MKSPLLLLTAALLCACGQKGDLYLPSQEREAVATLPTGPAASPAPEEDEDTEIVRPPAVGNPAGNPPANAGTNDGAR